MVNLTLDTLVYRREELLTTDLGGETGMLNIEKGKYFALSKVGTRVWELLEKPHTINELIMLLLEEYDIDLKTCQEDVMDFVNRMVLEDLVRKS